jgi:hypothetical protein
MLRMIGLDGCRRETAGTHQSFARGAAVSHDAHDHHDDPHEQHEHDKGLSHDLPRMARRGLLGLGAGLGVATLVACRNGDSTSTVADGEIPEEAAGPFPGDGSNGPNVLSESGVVRSDITTSFGDASGVAEGVSLILDRKSVV